MSTPHQIPINEPVCTETLAAISGGVGRPTKALHVNTRDNEVTFIVRHKSETLYKGPNRSDAVAIYNSLA